jgi:hypothetical protein
MASLADTEQTYRFINMKLKNILSQTEVMGGKSSCQGNQVTPLYMIAAWFAPCDNSTA